VHRFGGRDGVHARMWFEQGKGTGYVPVRESLTPAVLRAHLDGAITVGTYLVRHDNAVNIAVLDLDATRAALDHARGDADRSRDLRDALHTEGLRLRDALRATGFDPV